MMKKLRKWTAMFCAGLTAVSLLAGCGSKEEGNGLAVPEEKKENTSVSKEENTEKSMGRYLENEVVLPEELGMAASYPVPYMQKLSSGEIVTAEMAAGKYISSDNGESWEYAQCPWREILGTGYVDNVALSPEGASVVVYSPYGNADEEDMESDIGSDADETMKEGTEDHADKASKEEAEDHADEMPKDGLEDQTAEPAGTEENGAEESEKGSEAPSREVVWKYVYFDADGSRTDLELPLGNEEIVRSFSFDRQGRLYAFVSDHRTYRVDPADGNMKELFETEGTVDFACFTDRYMAGFTTRGEAVIYDLENELLMETDQVLQDFISENLGLNIGSMDFGHSIVAAGGEQDDIIYFAFDSGLYRHVIGGTAIEQVIDGASSSLGDPSMTLMDMMVLPDNEFLVLYKNVKLYRYTYDPNVPTVPDQQIKVYSLVENYSMRQAVSLFQKAHQDVYVRYEIGMTGEDGVTREDAIRNLNTKIMSGEGPDILLLDGLPQASYEEKGILADMSAVIDGMSGEDALFPNIVEACRKDGKIYTMPIRIQLPLMAGSKEYIQGIKDVTSLADAVERMRAEHPEGAVTGLRSAGQLLYVLGLTSSAAWTDENGNIDEAALEEFLTAAARIWQAEISGVDADWLEQDRAYSTNFSGEGRYYATLSTNAVSIAMKEQMFSAGIVYRVDFDYATLTSVARQMGDEFGFAFWNGQVSSGFIPDGLAGVSANSADNETVLAFYKSLFGRELQDMDLTGGLPVNMASFDTFQINPRAGMVEGDDDLSGGIAIGTDAGDYFSLDVKWPNEKEFQKLRDMTASVSCISTGDAAIEQAVYEIGPSALDGTMTPKEAVKEIVKKSAIYLAE